MRTTRPDWSGSPLQGAVRGPPLWSAVPLAPLWVSGAVPHLLRREQSSRKARREQSFRTPKAAPASRLRLTADRAPLQGRFVNRRYGRAAATRQSKIPNPKSQIASAHPYHTFVGEPSGLPFPFAGGQSPPLPGICRGALWGPVSLCGRAKPSPTARTRPGFPGRR